MKRAIVMGASSGMGFRVARQLLEEGWHVGMAARRIEPLNALRSEFPGCADVAAIDVTSDDAVSQLMQLIHLTGGVDLYFHASGVGRQNEELHADVELQTANTNVGGFTRMVDAVFSYMSSHGGGQIAVISSIAGTKGLGAAPSYSASKAYQNCYLQALRQLAHIRKLPIVITDIRPGFVDTPLLGAQHHYPMLMSADNVSRCILRAIHRQSRVVVIDWRYRLLVFFWRLLPGWLWERLRITTKS